MSQMRHHELLDQRGVPTMQHRAGRRSRHLAWIPQENALLARSTSTCSRRRRSRKQNARQRTRHKHTQARHQVFGGSATGSHQSQQFGEDHRGVEEGHRAPHVGGGGSQAARVTHGRHEANIRKCSGSICGKRVSKCWSDKAETSLSRSDRRSPGGSR